MESTVATRPFAEADLLHSDALWPGLPQYKQSFSFSQCSRSSEVSLPSLPNLSVRTLTLGLLEFLLFPELDLDLKPELDLELLE